MAVNCSPFGPKPQFEIAAGTPAVGYQLFFYVGGSVSTKQNTYTDSTGGSANTNPIVLNSLGQPTTEIWFTAGQNYKAVFATPTDSDPPLSPVWTIDHLVGINDTTTTLDQWVSGPAPTFVSGTSFTLVGDQTSTFQVGRRVKTTNTSGTVYSVIVTSVFGAVTTVTVVNDSTILDSGLSAVSYGLLSPTNPAIPILSDDFPVISGSADKTKKLRLEVDGFTTNTTRVWTLQNSSDTFVGLATTDTLTNKSLTSPTMTGIPIAPTAAPGTNTTQVATTAFTAAAITAASAGSSFVLIATASASASATVDFTSGITSTYDEYVVTMTDIIPATDNTQLYLRVSQSASFKSGAGNYSWAQTQIDSSAPPVGTVVDTSAASDTGMQVGFSLSNTTTRSYCGEVRFWNPAGAAKNKFFRSQYSSIPSSGAFTFASGGGLFVLNATAIDGIRFYMSAGNITSGNFALYGVKKT